MVSPIRFGGIASGLDTDSLVKQLMQAERMPMDRIFQKKQWAEWQRDAFRDVNSKMLEFRNVAADMRLQGTFSARNVTSTESSSVTARAVGAGANFSSQIKVTQVAEAAYINSATVVQKENTEGVMVNVDANQAADLVDFVGQTFSINGTNFEVKSTESLNQLITRVNNSDAGVSMFYDTHTGKVSMASKVTGEGGIALVDVSDKDGIAFADPQTDGFLQGFLNLNQVAASGNLDDPNDPNDPYVPANFSDGKNAQFILNGLVTERASNVFTVNSVEYNIKAVSNTTVTISSTTNTDAIFDKIKGFVDKYNELITELNGSLAERRYRDFPPLTDEQRNAMSDKEIEIWDSKAKSGLLRGDQMLSGMMADMRMKISDQVRGLGDGQFSTLFDIGIKTGDYSERGKLHIDENKLRQAIENKPEEIINLFTNRSDVAGEKGIGARIYESLNDSIKKLTDKAGRSGAIVDNSFMNRSIRQFDDQLIRFESRLADVENRYWRQFTAMEKAMSQLNSQGDWLMQNLAQQQGQR